MTVDPMAAVAAYVRAQSQPATRTHHSGRKPRSQDRDSGFGSLVDHAREFRHQFAAGGAEFRPQALFITCSDSRVLPSLITGAKPGELFELRTAGPLVPAYRRNRPAAEGATIEYALEVLKVANVVVCGHSHCGAVGALAHDDERTTAPAVVRWLRGAAPRLVAPGDPAPVEAVQRHVVAQLERLRAYPCIARRLAEGRMRLHGWIYEVHTGAVLAHRPRDDAFVPL